MDTKRFVTATVAGAAVIVGTGFLLFALPLPRSFLSSVLNAGSATGVEREVPMFWAAAGGAMAYSTLVAAFIAWRPGPVTIGLGMKIGAVAGFLLWCTADLMLYAVTNVGNLPAMLVAPLIELIPGAVAGGVIAALLRSERAVRPGTRAVAGAILLSCAVPGVAGAQQVTTERQSISVEESTGKEVRIVKADGGKLTGRLISLTASGVEIQTNGQSLLTELSAVRRVERVSHHVRTGLLLGVGASAVIWTLIYADTDCADCEDAYGMGAVFTAMSVGAGVGIGAIANKLTAPRRILYPQPSRAREFGVLPSLTPRRQGLFVAVRW